METLDTFHWPQMLSFSDKTISTLNINALETLDTLIKVNMSNYSSVEFGKTGYDIEVLVSCGTSDN